MLAREIHATESYAAFSSLSESGLATKILSKPLHLYRCFLYLLGIFVALPW